MKLSSSCDSCVFIELLLSDGSLVKENMWVLPLKWGKQEKGVQF